MAEHELVRSGWGEADFAANQFAIGAADSDPDHGDLDLAFAWFRKIERGPVNVAGPVG
jgi:hypothetical protein